MTRYTCISLFFMLFLILSQVKSFRFASTLSTFQQWNQCDSRWASVKIGFGNKTICQHGDLLTSITMVVNSVPTWVDPPGMNDWLKKYSGFTNVDQYVWDSLGPFGLHFGGMDNNTDRIENHLSYNHLVVVNYKNSSHWGLATSANTKNNSIHINDPVYEGVTQKLSNIGKFAWYQRTKVEIKIPNSLIQTVSQNLQALKDYLKQEQKHHDDSII